MSWLPSMGSAGLLMIDVVICIQKKETMSFSVPGKQLSQSSPDHFLEREADLNTVVLPLTGEQSVQHQWTTVVCCCLKKKKKLQHRTGHHFGEGESFVLMLMRHCMSWVMVPSSTHHISGPPLALPCWLGSHRPAKSAFQHLPLPTHVRASQ